MKKIFCQLVNNKSRRTWVVCPKQYDSQKQEILSLAVSIPQATIDRLTCSFGCVITIDYDLMKLSSTNKYYSYSGSILEVFQDPKESSAFSSYLNNRDKSPEEIEKIEKELMSTMFAQLHSDQDISQMRSRIKNNGFHINDSDFYLLIRNIRKSVNTMLLGPTGSGNFLRKICM